MPSKSDHAMAILSYQVCSLFRKREMLFHPKLQFCDGYHAMEKDFVGALLPPKRRVSLCDVFVSLLPPTYHDAELYRF